jgi:hypothetical protein
MARHLVVAVDVLLLFAAVLLEAARAAVRTDRCVETLKAATPSVAGRVHRWTQGDCSESWPLGGQSRRWVCAHRRSHRLLAPYSPACSSVDVAFLVGLRLLVLWLLWYASNNLLLTPA